MAPLLGLADRTAGARLDCVRAATPAGRAASRRALTLAALFARRYEPLTSSFGWPGLRDEDEGASGLVEVTIVNATAAAAGRAAEAGTFAIPPAYLALSLLVDFLFGLDLLLAFRTAFVDSEHQLILSPSLIWRRAVRRELLPGLLGCLPWELLDGRTARRVLVRAARLIEPPHIEPPPTKKNQRSARPAAARSAADGALELRRRST